MRATRRGSPDSAARLKALTRRAYTASAGHLDLDDDAGREFDRIVRGEEGEPRDGGERGHRGPPARRWAVSGRAVVVVLAVVAVLAGAVIARAIALGPSDAVPVPRLVEQVAGEADDGRHDGGGGPGEPAAGGTGAGGGGAPGDAGGGDGAAPGEVPGTGTPTTAAHDDGAPAAVVVHVAGAVAAAGVVTLPGGARVAEAVEAAGGALPDAELAAVNLARPLVDGEQVYVPRVGEAQPGAAAGPGTGPATADGGGGPAGGVVDLNTADLTALDTLPGVGPAIAQRILDWRAANGPFHSVEELLEVPGIGPATLERLRAQVRV